MGKKKKGSIYFSLTSNNDNLQRSQNTPNKDKLEIPESEVIKETEKKEVKESEAHEGKNEPEVVGEPELVNEPELVKEQEVHEEKKELEEPEEPEEPEVHERKNEPEVHEEKKELEAPEEPEVHEGKNEPELVKEPEVHEGTNEPEEEPIENVDYTKNLLNGYYSYVIACESITIFQCVEVLSSNGILQVRPTIPSSKNSFLGIAQNGGDVGQKIKVLTSGISKLRLRTNINLPAITKMNGQLAPMRDKIGRIITQTIFIQVNKNDLLVLAGTNSDILVGPSTQYYQYNASGNDGLLSVYKSIQINPNNGTYNLNYMEQNNELGLKSIHNGRFIQVLDINTESGEIIGYL